MRPAGKLPHAVVIQSQRPCATCIRQEHDLHLFEYLDVLEVAHPVLIRLHVLGQVVEVVPPHALHHGRHWDAELGSVHLCESA